MKYKRGDRVKIDYQEGTREDNYVGYGEIRALTPGQLYGEPAHQYYCCKLDSGEYGEFPERSLSPAFSLPDTPTLQRGFDRYEKVRRLSVQSFADLWHRNFTEGIPFDDLVDQIGEQK